MVFSEVLKGSKQKDHRQRPTKGYERKVGGCLLTAQGEVPIERGRNGGKTEKCNIQGLKKSVGG